ncbi:MAG: hypothetical protein ABIO81_00475 [Ginsengibacter sp.]
MTGSKNKLSLGIELGKLYHSVDDAITALNTQSISISNAKVILNDKSDTANRPVIFSNIYFSLKKLNKHNGSPGKYLDNNNIIFTSSNQDISLTDGIHKLSFKKLVMEKARNIILDSCTIIALPTHTSNNSFKIHFKKLALIGINFDTLYKTNLIQADSVYCENPVSNINLNSSLPASNMVEKGMPDLEKIIKGFSGNLDLGFVGVTNADIHLNIKGGRTQSNIHSAKVNFQIKNLRIDPDSSKLISMHTFDMLIKGYNLYNADSTCVYSFDSIRFANDKLLLNNFSVHTISGFNKIRNFRNYSMPYFELLGLDWPELIFKQNLKAKEAILHDPIINYIEVANVSISKKSIIFNSHHTFDDFMELGRLKIINGQLNMKWGDNNSLQLQGFNLNLLGYNLPHYKHIKLQRDIEALFFRYGFLKIGSIVTQLRNITFKADNELHAEELLINSKPGGVDSKFDDVSIKNISTRPGGNIIMDGLEWQHGNIIVNANVHSKANIKQSSVLLKNISGKQTLFKYLRDGMEGFAFFDHVQFSSLEINNNKPTFLNGFIAKGRNMYFFNAGLRLNCTNFLLSDNTQEFSGTHFENSNYAGTLVMNIPSIRLTNDINSLFTNDLYFKNVQLISPVIDFKKQNNSIVAGPKISLIPELKIDHIAIREPVIHGQVQNLSNQSFYLPYSKGSNIKAENLQVTSGGITLENLYLRTEKAEINKGNEKVLSVDKGIDLELSKINIPTPRDGAAWNAMLRKLNMKNSNGFTFNIKDNKLELKDIALGNCLLSSSNTKDIGKLLTTNHTAWVSTSEANYSTKNALLQSFNVNYKAADNILVLDSFNYQPSMSRDSAIGTSPYQIDYINFTSGHARLSGFDIQKFYAENTLVIQKAIINRPSIYIYRDKFPAFLAGVKKMLFVEKIKNISSSVFINQIEVKDGKVSYTEKNATTRREGNLLLTKLEGNFFNIKNYNIQARDSLSLAFKGSLLNSPDFNLNVTQSYTDPQYGFLMALSVEPAPLIFLNPLLEPLSNVKFTSGSIDKLSLKATGNENSAHGEMKFYYHSLHLHLLKKGENPKFNFIKKIESALVNTFILKTNNKERVGLIYFKRIKDRSFFNYMVKIINSGIATSVGVSKNRRYRKNMENDEIKP